MSCTARSSSLAAQGLDDLGVLFVRVRGGAGALVHQRDERAARDQIAQHTAPAPGCPSARPCAHESRPADGQLGASPWATAFFLAGHMLAQRAQFGGGDLAHEGADHFGLEHAAHGEHLAGFVGRGAPLQKHPAGLQPHQTVLRQLEQCLPHQRARHAKLVSRLLLGQLGVPLQAVLDDGAGQAAAMRQVVKVSMRRIIAAGVFGIPPHQQSLSPTPLPPPPPFPLPFPTTLLTLSHSAPKPMFEFFNQIPALLYTSVFCASLLLDGGRGHIQLACCGREAAASRQEAEKAHLRGCRQRCAHCFFEVNNRIT